MTWIQLCESISTGQMPLVKRGGITGQVVVIKSNRSYKGCAVDFGKGYDEFFYENEKNDKRSKYMSELDIIKNN